VEPLSGGFYDDAGYYDDWYYDYYDASYGGYTERGWEYGGDRYAKVLRRSGRAGILRLLVLVTIAGEVDTCVLE
jgi:hypothetical protein